MAAPWLEHYDPAVPHRIGTYPDKTLVDFFHDSRTTQPDGTAIIFKGRRLSYAEIDGASDALAHALERLGVKAGDRIALLMPNIPQFVIAEMAVWKVGAIIAPQSLLYTTRELSDALLASKPKMAIVMTPFYERVKALQREVGIERVIVTNVKEYLPALIGAVFTLLKEKKEGHRVSLRDDDLWLQDLIDDGSPLGRFPSRAKPENVAGIMMSGGTTGTPKGVASDHRGVIMTGIQMTAWHREAIQGGSPKFLVPLPLFHVYACYLIQSVCFVAGIPMILVPNPRDLDDVVKTIDREQPTLLCAVPTLFSALMANRKVEQGKVHFRSLRACFSGAAALMAETKRRFEEMTGARIIEGYSLSEATVACCSNPFRGTNKIGSVGMPAPDVEIRIVDATDATRELNTGETGEILLQAPQIMRGYWENPEETSRMVRVLEDGKRWLFTGDLGYLDDDGYLFIVDRKKDLIKTSGLQVWPREVEEVIATHPGVAEVGVAGLPDARKGEIVAAWIVPRAELTAQEIRAFCGDKLAPYKIPTRIEIRKELPKTLVGKVLRRVLVAEARAQMQA